MKTIVVWSFYDRRVCTTRDIRNSVEEREKKNLQAFKDNCITAIFLHVQHCIVSRHGWLQKTLRDGILEWSWDWTVREASSRKSFWCDGHAMADSRRSTLTGEFANFFVPRRIAVNGQLKSLFRGYWSEPWRIYDRQLAVSPPLTIGSSAFFVGNHRYLTFIMHLN